MKKPSIVHCSFLCWRVAAVLDYVTVLVAGHLAENVIDKSEPAISKRLEDNAWVLENPPNGPADRDRVALFLKRIQCNTMAEVLAAEQRARDILEARNGHVKDEAKRLTDRGTIDGADLTNALGKAGPGGAGG